ncbi:hypothetical protein D3C80_2008400 [compost metagenome]
MPVCTVGVASGILFTSTSHHGAPSLWARLMSSPGWARTTLPLLCWGGRLDEQLASTTPTARQVNSLKELAEMIARIT